MIPAWMTWAWVAWVAFGLVLEGYALWVGYGTLTAHWEWFRQYTAARVLMGAVLAWVLFHFLLDTQKGLAPNDAAAGIIGALLGFFSRGRRR